MDQQLILEAAKYEYGCLMLDLSINNWQKLLDCIDEEDIYNGDDAEKYGLETEPHITILYGLPNIVNVNDFNIPVH